MADNYLEKRYDAVFGKKTVTKRVGHTLDELLLKNRSTRGYNKSYVVSRNELQQIVAVNTKIGSGCNRQVLRFRLVTQGEEATKVLNNIKMGAALPELHLPFPGTEPEAFIIVCSTMEEIAPNDDAQGHRDGTQQSDYRRIQQVETKRVLCPPIRTRSGTLCRQRC